MGSVVLTVIMASNSLMETVLSPIMISTISLTLKKANMEFMAVPRTLLKSTGIVSIM